MGGPHLAGNEWELRLLSRRDPYGSQNDVLRPRLAGKMHHNFSGEFWRVSRSKVE